MYFLAPQLSEKSPETASDNSAVTYPKLEYINGILKFILKHKVLMIC